MDIIKNTTQRKCTYNMVNNSTDPKTANDPSQNDWQLVNFSK